LPKAAAVDDGHRPTLLSSFVQKFSRKLNTQPTPLEAKEETEEPAPELFSRSSLVELHVSLPTDLKFSREAFEPLLSSLSRCKEPIAFELLGLPGKVTIQFAACANDASALNRQLQAYFPEAAFLPKQDVLKQSWNSCEGADAFVLEFGLAREFMFPLPSG